MLIRFIVENYLSYKKRMEFAMLPGKVRRMEDHLINIGDINLLKCGVIYGANASGKSNLIKAVMFSSDIITKGLENINTSNKYFRIDEECKDTPSIFEYEISVNEEVYSYGFAVILSTKKIIEEWLYLKKNNSEECIFDREWLEGETTIKTDINFSNSKVKNRFEVYKEDIKGMHQKLFLAEIANKNIEDIKEIRIFKDIYDWFKDNLIVIFPSTKYLGVNRIATDLKQKEIFSKYLNYFDTGITDIKSKSIDTDEFFNKLPNEVKLEYENMKQGMHTVLILENKVYSIEKSNNGKIDINKLGIEHNHSKDLFELEEESDGTVRLFDLIPLLSLMLKGKTIFIDEIDRNFHPKLTIEFIKLFYKLSGENKTQLIVTTHESHLLDLNLFRRDEIWFAERDNDSNSKIYSLDVFQDRYDKKVEKDYLIGRYGAIPIFNYFDTFIPGGNSNEQIANSDKI